MLDVPAPASSPTSVCPVRPGSSNAAYQFGGTNLTGRDNYTILEAEGHGHYVGCVLNFSGPSTSRRWRNA